MEEVLCFCTSVFTSVPLGQCCSSWGPSQIPEPPLMTYAICWVFMELFTTCLPHSSRLRFHCVHFKSRISQMKQAMIQ